MKERTEEEKVARAPIEVILGGNKYNIAPLVMEDSLPWKKRVAQSFTGLPKLLGITMDKPDQFQEGLMYLMVEGPEQVIDLFFDYARELDKTEIGHIATEAEIAVAFGKVVEYAFGPLAESQLNLLKRLSQ